MLRLLPLLPLLACAGTVNVEAIDGGFGAVMSALRVVQDTDLGDTESIVITNVTGACGKLQAVAEATEDYLDAALDLNNEDYCADLEEPFLAYAEAQRSLVHSGTRVVQIFGPSEFDDDEYTFGEDVAGSVTVYTEDPWDEAIYDFDPDGGLLEACEVDVDDLDGGPDVWSVVDGDLEITRAEKGRASGSVDAELLDEDGDEDGDIVMRFDASPCEIEY